MDFFPLEYPEQDAVDGLNDALDAIGQSITPILTDIGSGLFEQEEQIEAAILALFRKTKSCLTRCITPFENQLEPVVQGLLQELNDQLDNLQQQALQVQGSLQQQKLTGGMQSLGTWWFLVGSPLPGKITFNPGSPHPPTQDANWRGPYGSAQAAQQAYNKTGGSASVPQIPSQEGQYPGTPTATQTPTVAPILTGNPPVPVSPQMPPPSLPVKQPAPRPTRPPPVPPSEEPIQQQSVAGPYPPPFPQQSVTVDNTTVEQGQQLQQQQCPPCAANVPQGRSSVKPYCGVDPSMISGVIGHAIVPVAWFPDEEADTESDCGIAQIQAARGGLVSAAVVASAYRSENPGQTLGIEQVTSQAYREPVLDWKDEK